MESTRGRTLVILLLISTFFVAIIAIVLAQLIQTSQAPQNSSAFGFGEAVNKEYFDLKQKLIYLPKIISNFLIKGRQVDINNKPIQ